jgi:hypothetical protein
MFGHKASGDLFHRGSEILRELALQMRHRFVATTPSSYNRFGMDISEGFGRKWKG